MVTVLESEIERKCVGIAEKHECLLLKIEKRRGWPDRILMAPNGSMMFIEFKKVGETLMPMQRHIHQMICAMQFRVEVVDNFSLFLTLVLQLKRSSPPFGNPSHTKSGDLTG